MPNKMKHTQCNICGQNMEDWTFDKCEAHALKHTEYTTGQTGMEDFIHD